MELFWALALIFAEPGSSSIQKYYRMPDEETCIRAANAAISGTWVPEGDEQEQAVVITCVQLNSEFWTEKVLFNWQR